MSDDCQAEQADSTPETKELRAAAERLHAKIRESQQQVILGEQVLAVARKNLRRLRESRKD